MLPTWVCGSIGVVARFGSIEGESVVGGVASVGVWVSCWWCWWCCQRGVLLLVNLEC
jgi:hypothetical protein